MDKLPVRLRARRAEKRDTQAEAAEAVGVSRKSFASWEQGGAFPGVLVLGKVAEYLALSALEVERLRPVAASD